MPTGGATVAKRSGPLFMFWVIEGIFVECDSTSISLLISWQLYYRRLSAEGMKMNEKCKLAHSCMIKSESNTLFSVVVITLNKVNFHICYFEGVIYVHHSGEHEWYKKWFRNKSVYSQKTRRVKKTKQQQYFSTKLDERNTFIQIFFIIMSRHSFCLWLKIHLSTSGLFKATFRNVLP